MAAEAVAEPGLARLNLSAEETRNYRQLFRQADTGKVGVVTGEVAVPFFERTRLDSRVLGEIWRLADQENRGFLTYDGFAIVLRLIGHAQAGRQPSQELAMQQGPLPRFDGYAHPPGQNAASASSTPTTPLAPSHTGGHNNAGSSPGLVPQATGRFPPLTPDRVSQYMSLFERQPLQNGMLPGEVARQLFVKSNLSGDVLRRIWELSDTEQRGSLAQTEFVIAMHLLSSMKSGALRDLPNVLPAALYEAATRRGPAPPHPLPPATAMAAKPQQPMATGAPMAAVPRQLTGSGSQPRAGSPLGRPPMGPQQQQHHYPNPAPQGGGEWLITPQDKVRFDQIFDSIAKDGKGFIAGDEAVDFMRQSNLPEPTLAIIWDLSDINADGALNRDEFAVAMWLIRQQRSGPSGSIAMPTVLPPNLIPPSMRAPAPTSTLAQRPQTAGSMFDAPTTQLQSPAPPLPPLQAQRQASAPVSAMNDLFGLEPSSPSSPRSPARMQVPLSTGGSSTQDPFAGGNTALRNASPPPLRAASGSTAFRFVPSSMFGRSLTSQTTGDSKGTPSSIADDLLGDPDPEVNKQLNNDSTELANLSNQVGSLSKQLHEVQTQRGASQNEFDQTSQQAKNFQQRLAQLRTLYEKEAADTRALGEQLNNARKETQKLQTECLSLEGKNEDLKREHQQLVSALQADQQENSSLREKIRIVSNEITQIRAQVERLKLEARQQKGLVAINKKQLSAGESDRDRLRGEADDLAATARSASALEDNNRTSSPVSMRDTGASPAASISGANNPFFRRTGTNDMGGIFANSPPRSMSAGGGGSGGGGGGADGLGADRTFDDVFGPAFARSGSTNTPPPPTSFVAQHTGTSTASAHTPAFSTPPTTSYAVPVSPPAAETNTPNTYDGGLAPSFFKSVFPDLTDRTKHSATPGASSERQATPNDGSRAPSPATTRSADATPGPMAGGSPFAATMSRADAMTPPPPSASATATADADGFAGPADSAKAKADFENAFASFTKSKKSQDSLNAVEPNKSAAAFHTEFPPISELERDDESDSASEQGGFDDDFAPASPRPGNQSGAMGGLNESGNGADGESRQMPHDAKSSRPSTPIGSVQSADPFGTATPRNQTQPSQSQTNSLDDDDFDGLEDAKEGSADGDFANLSRSTFDDFNPVFDSSPSASLVRGEGQPFGTDMGTDSGYDFGTMSTELPSGAGSQPAATVPASQKGESHDWDAIFADLDGPKQQQQQQQQQQEGQQTGPSYNPASSGVANAAAATETSAEHDTAAQDEPQVDDPMIKNLMGMGYSRTRVVAALEKNDYNLERAANYLASES